MAVEFPCDLRIAHLIEVEVADLVPGPLWRAFRMHCVQMPVNLLAILEALIAEEIKSVTANLISLLDDVINNLRKAAAQIAKNLRDFCCIKEKTPAIARK